MRKVRLIFIILLVSLILITCATFEQNTYRSLYLAGTTYDTAMKKLDGLQNQGKITQTQRDQINKVALIYYNSYQTAVKAFEIYKQTSLVSDKDKLVTAITLAASNWGTLASLVNSIIPNSLSPKLPQ